MGSDPRVDRAVTRLADSADGDHIVVDASEILTAALQNVGDVDATQHPLGFVHMDLSMLAQTDFIVRLHIWTARSLAAADILGGKHDHVWSLKSTVLLGALVDIELRAQNTSTGAYALGEVLGEQSEDALEPRGLFDIEEVRRRSLAAGDVYTIAPRTLHETEVAEPPTATLVLARDELPGGPLIATPSVLELPTATRRTPLSEKDSADVLKHALRRLW